MFTTVSKNHIFYQNAKENSKKPPWFIDCGRNEAEEILKKFQNYGNVLIRPNSSFAKNGSYALSAATKLNGEVKFVHYQINRTPNGFKLEVQSKPAPMPCLHSVLDFYISAAGFQDHRGFVIDPKGNDGKYVDMSNSKNTKEHEYVPMSGCPKRRSSAPPVSLEYINASLKPGCGDGQDYINVNGTKAKIPARTHSLTHDDNANYPQPHGKNDKLPLCRARPVPLEPIYLEPSNADEDDDDDLDIYTFASNVTR